MQLCVILKNMGDKKRKYTRRKIGYVSPFKGVSPKGERNKHLVSVAGSGNYTLEELGKMFGITRERVRQIYKKCTGKDFSARRDRNRKLKNILKVRRGNAIMFNCQSCGSPVSKNQGSRLRKYCRKCRDAMLKDGRDRLITLSCSRCGTKYHPFRSSSFLNIDTNFCSADCYSKFRQERASKNRIENI